MILTKLRPYQDEAVRTACAYDGFCLFPEQRTGKCLITLAIVDRYKPDALVIVCPKKAVREWDKQIDEHLDLDWNCDIYIVTYQAPVKNKKLRQEYYKWSSEFVKEGNTLMVVADEAHYIKKPGTAQSRFTRTLGKRANWRLALTGTPTDEGLEQYWAVYDFIQHNTAFNTYEFFKERYVIYETAQRKDGRKYPVITGYQRQQEMMDIIHKYSYRITFNQARREMGKKPVIIRKRKEYFDLTKRSRGVYEEMDAELEAIVDEVTISTPLPVTKVQKLQQICGGFLLDQVRVPGRRKRKRIIVKVGDEKLNQLMKLLSGFNADQRAVICCRFTHEIEAIAEAFDKFKWTYKIISGQHEWDHNFDVDFVILQAKSGLGFDLSEANTYVLYSWDHSYITFEQARMRIMNMEHTTRVNYFFLIARDTIEETYYEAITRKKDLSTLVLDKYRGKKKTPKRRGAVRKGARRIRRTREAA